MEDEIKNNDLPKANVIKIVCVFLLSYFIYTFMYQNCFHFQPPNVSAEVGQNKLLKFPKFKHGPVKSEKDVIFVEKESTVTIYNDTGIQSPLFYHENPHPTHYLGTSSISSYREKFTFYHLRNAFVSSDELIGLEEGGYWESFIRFKTGNYRCLPTVAGYRNIVFPIFHWYWAFGHFLNEAVCSLLSTPQWVWDRKPAILIKVDHGWIVEYLKILNLENIEIVHINKGFVYGENVYVTRAFEDVHGFGIRAFPILREKIYKYYDLYKIQPTEYFVGNKKPGKTRHYTNMEEIRNILINDTKLNWKQLKDDFSDRVAAARTYASAKLIILPCGSISFNVLFMKKYTGTVQLMAERIEFPSTRMSLMLGVWTLAILHPNMKHFGGPGKANVPVVVESTKYVLYAINHGEWPKYGNNYHIGFNISLFKKFYEKNGDIWLDFNDVYPYEADRDAKYL